MSNIKALWILNNLENSEFSLSGKVIIFMIVAKPLMKIILLFLKCFPKSFKLFSPEGIEYLKLVSNLHKKARQDLERNQISIIITSSSPLGQEDNRRDLMTDVQDLSSVMDWNQARSSVWERRLSWGHKRCQDTVTIGLKVHFH